MKTLILLFGLLCFASVVRATDIGAADGQIVFSNGAPTAFQLALSTTIPNLPLDTFKALTTDKPSIVDEVLNLEAVLSAVEHFIARYPAFTTVSTVKTNKLKAQINLLVAIYNSL